MHTLDKGCYSSANNKFEREVFHRASQILEERHLRGKEPYNSNVIKDFLTYKLAHYEREVFSIIFLDEKGYFIEYRELFYGTINAASVYPREVVRAALETKASSLVLSHNHPSGEPEPSNADIRLTERLQKALAVIDVEVKDHIVVGKECVSFSERGLL